MFIIEKKNLYKLKGQMSDYLAKTRAQCSVINSLAFPNVLKKSERYLYSFDIINVGFKRRKRTHY